MEPITKHVVKCSNAHCQCERCHIKVIQCALEQGRSPFREKTAQRCFICRESLPDHRFSEQYTKLLPVAIGVSMGKYYGYNGAQHNRSIVQVIQTYNSTQG